MTSHREAVISEIIQLERGYSHHPVDRGGETYHGISRIHHRDWPGWRIIDGLKSSANFTTELKDHGELQQMVRQFYVDNYWNRIGLYRGFADTITNGALAKEMMDIAVNMGLRRLNEFVQRICNVLNKQGALWPDIPVDGLWGPKTQYAYDSAIKMIGSPAFSHLLNILQGCYYIHILENNPSQEVFAWGWIKRRVLDFNRT